jgi:hypothetical protein
MRKLLVLGSLVALLVPAASHASPFSLGLRLGFAPAMGDAAKDTKLSDGVKSQIPIQLDATYSVLPDLAVGGYFAYGLGQVNSDICQPGADCSASSMRLGLQALYTFNQVKAPMVPWVGAGFGYEWASMKQEAGSAKFEQKANGFEFLNLQVGGDYKVNEKFAIGPYAQFSIAQYSNQKVTNSVDPTENLDGSIPNKGIHEWFGFGVRGKFDL